VRQPYRAFTLIELLVAGVITAFVLGGVSFSLAQLGRAKNTSKVRFDAHIRADAALNAIRKDIIAITRTDDLSTRGSCCWMTRSAFVMSGSIAMK
jgi:type II secretory pathway component PulJ